MPGACWSNFTILWTIEAPEGYALLFTHPVNRFGLPFTPLTGLVDCDRYYDTWIHFPARWNDCEVQRRAAEGDADCAALPNGRGAPRRSLTRRRGRSISPARSRARWVSTAGSIGPDSILVGILVGAQEGRGEAWVKKCAAVRGGGERHDGAPASCGAVRVAARNIEWSASRSPISKRHLPRLIP